MSDKNEKPVTITSSTDYRHFRDSQGNSITLPGKLYYLLRPLYGEKREAEVKGPQQNTICKVDLEALEAIKSRPTLSEVLFTQEVTRPSPIGPLPNLCKKDEAHGK